MGGSFQLYVLPDKRFRLALVESRRRNPPQNAPRQFRITSPPELVQLASGERHLLQGWMSPIQKVTLPEGVKESAGIPEKATHFAYVHPKPQLAKRIDWKRLRRQESEIDRAKKLAQSDEFEGDYEDERQRDDHGNEEQEQEEENDDADIHGGQMPRSEHDVPFLLKQGAQSSELMSALDLTAPDESENRLAWCQTILLGGYAYFDSEGNFLKLNTLSFTKSSYEVRLTGPFLPTQAVMDEMEELYRMHQITLGVLHEVGFVACGWIHPREKFRDDIPATWKNDNFHGGFLFRKDDGRHLLYMVDPQGVDVEGFDVFGGSSLRDAMLQYQRKASLQQERERLGGSGASSIVTGMFQLDNNLVAAHKNMANFETSVAVEGDTEGRNDDDDNIVSAILQLMEVFDNPDFSEDYKKTMTEQFYEEFKFHITVLHWACQLQAPAELIQELIELDENRASIDVQDQAGWLPLHHACRFTPDAEDVIQLLLNADGRHQSVRKRDNLKRCPLHLVCDSDSGSVGVVRALLRADPQKKTIHEQSRFLGWLPLHFACANGASAAVIKELLEADSLGTTVKCRSEDGLYPIHLALRRGAGPETIQALVDKDPEGITILTRFDSMTEGNHLPIHIACALGSSPKVIQILLDKDERGKTLQEEISSHHGQHGSLNRRVSEGMIPLHIACSADKPNHEVIQLLLNADDGDKYTLTSIDNQLRLPLHVALCHNASLSVIKMLLMYQQEAQIRHADLNRRYPIHYACQHGCSAEIVDLLLETEEAFHSYEESGNLKNLTKRDKSGHRPIFYAVRDGADAEVMLVMLQGHRFGLKGLDARLLSRLGQLVSTSKPLQECINKRSSERAFVGLLLGELYVNLILLVIYMKATEQYAQRRHVGRWEVAVLIGCGIYFLLRELLRAQQLWRFLSDFWSIVDIGRVVSVLLAAFHMMQDSYSGSQANLHILLLAGNFIIIGFILFLRSTFLPFATFVGGIIQIVKTLVTFLVTSSFFLLAFAYTFFVEACHGNRCDPQNPTDDDGYVSSLTDAYRSVLLSFFAGQNNAASISHILFGILAVIVLLNVVIAIVSNEWDRTTADVSKVFWEFRLYFLADTDVFADFVDDQVRPLRRTCVGRLIWGFVEWVDRTPSLRFRDQVNWSKAPFSGIRNWDQYVRPERYFLPSELEALKGMRSLQADLKWLPDKENSFAKAMVVMKWVGLVIQYALLILVGVPTFGYTWPRGLRTAFIGNNYHDPKESASQEQRLIELNDGLNQLAREFSEMKEAQGTVVEGNGKEDPKKQMDRVEKRLDDLFSSFQRTRSTVFSSSSHSAVSLRSTGFPLPRDYEVPQEPSVGPSPPKRLSGLRQDSMGINQINRR